MSDPMTNRDVEDVLASIRRLVSDDARTGSAKVQRPPSDRLVLTPSLRVTDEQDVADDDVADDDVHDDAQASDAEIDDADIDDPQTEDAEDNDLSAFAQLAFGTQESDSSNSDEPQNDIATTQEAAVFATLSTALSKNDDDDDDASVADDAPEAPEHGEAALSVSDEESSHDDEIATEAEPFLNEDDDAPSRDEGNDAPFHDDDDAAPFRDEDAEEALQDAVDDAPISDEVDEAPFMDVGDEAPFVDVDDTEVPIVPEDWDPEPARPVAAKKVDEPEPAAATLSEKIAALETLVGERRDRFEPDDAGADAYAGTEPPAMEWEDEEPKASPQADAPVEEVFEDTLDAEPEFEKTDAPNGTAYDDLGHNETEGAPDPDVAEPVEASLGLFASDDDVLDEEALRELISDIVREELQGALGERITRNVRKLVRREIHRALAAQDFE